MKQYFIIISIFLSLLHAKDAVTIKANQPGLLIIEVAIDSAWITKNDGRVHSIPTLDTYLSPGAPIIPYWNEVLIGVPANADINVFSGNEILVGEYSPIISGNEKAKGIDFELPLDFTFDGNFPKNNVVLYPIKNVNGVLSSRIEVFPFSIKNGQLFLSKLLTIQIKWDVSTNGSRAKLLSKTSMEELRVKDKLTKPKEHVIPEYQFSNNIAKIVVDLSAWYKITGNDLIANGINLSNTNPNTMRLWNKEDEIPLYIKNANDSGFKNDDLIVFYGIKNPAPEGVDYENNFYTDENVYWMTWGAGEGKRFDNDNVSPNQPENNVFKPQNYLYLKKIERDDEYVRLNRLNQYLLKTWDVVDHFYMLPEVIVGRPYEFEFELDAPNVLSNSGFELELYVRGMTTSAHDLDIYINNNLVGNGKWNDRNVLKIKLTDLDCTFLNQGKNILALVLSPSDASAHDLIWLNWFSVEYPKYYTTNTDYLYFSSDSIPGQKQIQFEIGGFSNSDILLFKNRNELLTEPQVEYNNQLNNYLIKFQDDNLDQSTFYDAITYNKLLNVKSISKENAIKNLLSDIQSGYIAIAPDSFISTLSPLIAFHNGITVDVQDIYRQYSFGVLSPYAIKMFLNNIYEKHNSLKYVLIAMGSDQIDWWTGRFARQPSIPAMLVYTYQMGVVVCDYWYSSFDDEYWVPNISVGRFPINNIQQLQSIINKAMFHHSRITDYWDNNVLLIGGSDVGFRYQSETLVDNIKNNGNFVSRLYVAPSKPDSAYYGTADTLNSHFKRGLSYINFFGHGGGRVWEDNNLLHFNNLNNLNNNFKLPLIASMSCYTADFSFKKALGRQMVEIENGGAIAWYAASGLGWNYNDYYMTVPLQELLFSDNDLTIGEIINLSKTRYYLSYSDIYPEIAASQIYQYNLIGDPAIKLKKPIKDESLRFSPLDPEPGENIEISTSISITDSIFHQIFLPDNYALNKSTLLGNSLPQTISLPDTFSKGIHSINLAFKSGDKLYNTSQIISVLGSYVNILNTTPLLPTMCDSIGVTAEISDRNGISSAMLIINGENWANLENTVDNLYSLQKLIPPQPSGTILNLSCQVIDTNNDTTNSLPKIVTISDIPDISPKSGQFRIDDNINITVDIESTTTTPVTANVDLYVLNDNSWELIGQDTVNFGGLEINEAKFSGYYPVGINTYQVITRANLTCMSTAIMTDDTLTFSLETTAFWVTPELGTTDDGITHRPIGIKDVEINILPGQVAESSILQISKLSEIVLLSQSDFQFAEFGKDYGGIQIRWDTPYKYKISWDVGTIAIQDDRKMFGYYNTFRNWLSIPFETSSDSSITFNTLGATEFTFLQNFDVEKPSINTTINGQKFLRDNYLNTNPAIQFNIYDKNGIDHRADSIYISINDQQDKSIISEISGSGNNINFLIQPNLTKFDSTMAITVQDAAGNPSDTLQLSFIVSEKLDLIDYGNFPNPFSENTIFAYELTDFVEKLTITIYTVEGRKICQLSSDNIISGLELNQPGYHEVEWNGRNQDGIKVGNGNYFYQIRAKEGKTVLEKTGKLLKAQ